VSNVLTNVQNMTRESSLICNSRHSVSFSYYCDNFLTLLTTICGSAHIQSEPGKVPRKIRQNVKITETVVAPESLRWLPTADEPQEERNQLHPLVLA